MTLKRIYIARHGYGANWLPIDQQPENPTGIDSDPPLAPHGVDQSKEMGEYFYNLPEEEQPQLIFTSPFYRCVETVEPTAKNLKLQVFLERGVGEWYKPDRGVIPEPANHERLSKFFDNVSKEWDWATVK
ncbi:unnamed protein product [Ambrosiozyma monospora]|uniref:Unnamed protein product n=1 Tax=Ambrosiozyma monospora TaxID=43982 RepID=A0ACB5U4F6_AMBMO|nr:unnamed protein product [Ambrosiozyma monospora]